MTSLNLTWGSTFQLCHNGKWAKMVDILSYFCSSPFENGNKKMYNFPPLLLQYNFLIFLRDRWSEDLASQPHLSSPDHSEEELEIKEEVENEQDKEEHIYHSLDRQENWSVPEPVYSLPIKLLKVRIYKKSQLPCLPWVLKVFLLRTVI